MKYILEFDPADVFPPIVLGTVLKYFDGGGEVRPSDVCDELGWSREVWERHLAGLFDLGKVRPATTIELEVRETAWKVSCLVALLRERGLFSEDDLDRLLEAAKRPPEEEASS